MLVMCGLNQDRDTDADSDSDTDTYGAGRSNKQEWLRGGAAAKSW